MATHVEAFIYGQNLNDWGREGGVKMSFPVNACLFYQNSPAVVLSGVSTMAKIKVLASATDFYEAPEFYTDQDVTDLNTAANL